MKIVPEVSLGKDYKTTLLFPLPLLISYSSHYATLASPFLPPHYRHYDVSLPSKHL